MQLPVAFTEQMRTLLGNAEWEAFCTALDMPPQVSLRPNINSQLSTLNYQCRRHSEDFVNGRRSQTDAKKSKSDAATFELSNFKSPVPWSSIGHYLSRRPEFIIDPAFHAGAYYVQEASSMFVEQALRQCGEPKLALDLCAAPGGKSTLLRSLLPDDALLVCNEPVRSRANILRENIIKWGHEGCMVTCNYPKDFVKLGAMFDLILVDAPCSGEGMFRKDNPAVEMWSPANVEECARRQRDILQTIWPALQSGGYLIYSTCTYNTRENEENVRFICETLGAEAVDIPIDKGWNITGSLLKGFDKPVYRFMPHKTRGEGFFLALLRKNGEPKNIAVKKAQTTKPLPKEYIDILQTDRMATIDTPEVLYAVSAAHAPIVEHLLKTLYPLHMGVALCERKGKKLIPHHSLAMSRLLSKDAYPRAELSLQDALEYLRHEAIRIDAPKGYVIVSYSGFPLGFVNNLGSRANNLYPAEWRIRKR